MSTSEDEETTVPSASLPTSTVVAKKPIHPSESGSINEEQLRMMREARLKRLVKASSSDDDTMQSSGVKGKCDVINAIIIIDFLFHI